MATPSARPTIARSGNVPVARSPSHPRPKPTTTQSASVRPIESRSPSSGPLPDTGRTQGREVRRRRDRGALTSFSFVDTGRGFVPRGQTRPNDRPVTGTLPQGDRVSWHPVTCGKSFPYDRFLHAVAHPGYGGRERGQQQPETDR